jgi:hypothetical protein
MKYMHTKITYKNRERVTFTCYLMSNDPLASAHKYGNIIIIYSAYTEYTCL